MGATDGQSTWPKTRKTLRKPGFLSGQDRNRTFGCFLGIFEEFERYTSWKPEYCQRSGKRPFLPALTHYRRGCVCSVLDRFTIHRNRFCQAGIWYSFRSRYRLYTRCLLTFPCGLGDCMNVASRLLRNTFAGSSDLGNNWIGHFNSPVNQMVCRSMVVQCLGLDMPVRSLGGALGLRYACSSTSTGIVCHERRPWRYVSICGGVSTVKPDRPIGECRSVYLAD